MAGKREPSQLQLPLAEAMGAALMQRIDPSRNMARFYGLAVERDLFGRVVLVRTWGRIGAQGVVRRDEHASEPAAWAALSAMARAKQRRGYV